MFNWNDHFAIAMSIAGVLFVAFVVLAILSIQLSRNYQRRIDFHKRAVDNLKAQLHVNATCLEEQCRESHDKANRLCSEWDKEVAALKAVIKEQRDHIDGQNERFKALEMTNDQIRWRNHLLTKILSRVYPVGRIIAHDDAKLEVHLCNLEKPKPRKKTPKVRDLMINEPAL